ncbi:hypothetical protein P691DRAFT_804491 [Macrolepiota fuliginosa MF-IS2]|uniref:Uncharacterized protein n=1 Tax=Macrolepiota fuliginosa MF-IS2 TaxID=1400762 RepID=A0A9P5X8T1_9AGAR|nr:hypothetical protein P691DRAFT_804491 [Macrolepiota fuliginosa MF-IS2]
MPHYTNQDDLFAAPQSSHFLAPSKSVPRRPSRQSITSRKSSASLLAPSSLAHALNAAEDDDAQDDGNTLNGAANGGSRQHSLAHELAFALMPEPSAGSKLLAEEFGIEYDEGAEGIDEPVNSACRNSGLQPEEDDVEQEKNQGLLDQEQHALLNGVDEALANDGDAADIGLAQGHSFADELNGHGGGGEEGAHDDEDYEGANGFGSPVPAGKRRKPVIKVQRPEADAMDVLAQDLESTENFLKHLRTLDSDSTLSTSSTRATSLHPSQQPALERYASDIIRRMDEAARNREGQLRELLEYDREFKKIAGEVGGTEVLSRVDEFPSLGDEDADADHDSSSSMTLVTPTATSSGRALDTLAEEDQTQQNEWDIDPHAQVLGEDISPSTSVSPSPIKATFSLLPPPPPIPAPSKTTPASAIPHLTHIRKFTSSLISSLTTLSEQAQVNGAATTEAGRKIKALKNKMGGWQSEWESAEKSRVRIERWEAGIVDGQIGDGADDVTLGSVSPARLAARRRVDGRKLVEEFLSASEKAIREATERTQAIMAR